MAKYRCQKCGEMFDFMRQGTENEVKPNFCLECLLGFDPYELPTPNEVNDGLK